MKKRPLNDPTAGRSRAARSVQRKLGEGLRMTFANPAEQDTPAAFLDILAAADRKRNNDKSQ